MSAALIDALTELGGVTITVRHDLEPSSQRLMETLGVTVVVDPRAASCEPRLLVTSGRDRYSTRPCLKCAALDRLVA